jgi:hypothetical protein
MRGSVTRVRGTEGDRLVPVARLFAPGFSSRMGSNSAAEPGAEAGAELLLGHSQLATIL